MCVAQRQVKLLEEAIGDVKYVVEKKKRAVGETRDAGIQQKGGKETNGSGVESACT